MRAGRGLCATLAALLAGGCGGAGGDPTTPAPPDTAAVPATTPATPADPVLVQITLAAPAAARARGGRPVLVRLRGTATPGQVIALRAPGCGSAGCRGSAVVDRRGDWQGRLRVPAPRGGTARVRLTAGYLGVGDASSSATRTLRIRSAAAPSRPVPRRPATRSTTAPAPVPVRVPVRRLQVIGDSLSVGTEPLLGPLLPSVAVTTDARTSRPLGDGLARLAALAPAVPGDALALLLFTNDDPRALERLRDGVRRSLAWAGAQGCVLWATIARPGVGGATYGPANAILRQAAAASGGRLGLVAWAEAVAAHPDWLAPDGVHGTPAGYRGRAALIAGAVRRCPGG